MESLHKTNFVAEKICIRKTFQNIRSCQGLPKGKCRFVGEGKAYASLPRGEIFCEVVFLALTIFQGKPSWGNFVFQ